MGFGCPRDCTTEGMSNSVLHWWVELYYLTTNVVPYVNMEGVNFKSEVNATPGANGVMIWVSHIWTITNL
jgi:hypothetical protein